MTLINTQSNLNNKAKKLRLYLVRHGQTVANLEGRVLGQTESPLTGIGELQARAAGIALQDIIFDQVYTSPLQRAVQTLEYILQYNEYKSSDMQINENIIERAKGVREGRSKKLSREEAVNLFRKEQLGKPTQALPFEETEEQVWKRFQGFISGILKEHMDNFVCATDSNTQCSIDNSSDDEVTVDVLNVLAVSHSGTIRIVLNQLFGYQFYETKHSSPQTTETGMLIPNGSVSIIDISLPTSYNNDDGYNSFNWLDEVGLVELTRTSHLNLNVL